MATDPLPTPSSDARHEAWGSRLGVVLAVAGSAVGLGNFLRFPGNVAENGGGIFMIPYFVSMILLGIPLVWAEWSLGRYGGRYGFHSSPGIMGLVGRHASWRYLGSLGIVIPIIILMYYALIEAWCLMYAWNYLVGAFELGDTREAVIEGAGDTFNTLVGTNKDGAVFNTSQTPLLWFWLITVAVNLFIIYHGVAAGIERFCLVAMPMMAVAAIVVLIRVLTLPGQDDGMGGTRTVLDGLGFMWNPQPTEDGGSSFAYLLNAEVWLAAAGQIFFSLSVGFGIIVNYASYLKRKDDVVLSGLTAASTNQFFEVCLGGLITIPAGFLFLGLALEGSLSSTFSMGFNVLPVVFSEMPLGRFFGFLWFFMLFLAAITSSLSMLQPGIAFLEEGLNIGRRASTTLLGLVSVLGSAFVLYFSGGLVALDMFDFWVGSLMIFILSMVIAILLAWRFGAERARAEAQVGAAIPIPAIWTFVIRYVTPTYLLVIFVFWCINNLPERIAKLFEPGAQVQLLSLLFIAAFFVAVLVLIGIASSNWGDASKLPPPIDKDDEPQTPAQTRDAGGA